MTFDDKVNILVKFRDYLEKRKINTKEIESFTKKLNLKRFYMTETATKEEIAKYLESLYDEELNGQKFINPETFEIIWGGIIQMKLIPTCIYKADGTRLINGYKVTLSKIECEKNGFKAGDELEAIFKNNEITIKKKD